MIDHLRSWSWRSSLSASYWNTLLIKQSLCAVEFVIYCQPVSTFDAQRTIQFAEILSSVMHYLYRWKLYTILNYRISEKIIRLSTETTPANQHQFFNNEFLYQSHNPSKCQICNILYNSSCIDNYSTQLLFHWCLCSSSNPDIQTKTNVSHHNLLPQPTSSI